MASQNDKEALVLKTSGDLSVAEVALDEVIKAIAKGHNYGMLSTPERDSFVHRIRAANETVKAIHADLTGIAQREEADERTCASHCSFAGCGQPS